MLQESCSAIKTQFMSHRKQGAPIDLVTYSFKSSTVFSECYVCVDCRWFRQLNNHFGVRGEAYYLYKPKGKSRTIGLSGEEALRRLKNGLHDPQMAFIYHSYNHYFCPIGYDDSPSKAVDAYRWVLTLDLLKTPEE